jgi:hypothetical protein
VSNTTASTAAPRERSRNEAGQDEEEPGASRGGTLALALTRGRAPASHNLHQCGSHTIGIPRLHLAHTPSRQDDKDAPTPSGPRSRIEAAARGLGGRQRSSGPLGRSHGRAPAVARGPRVWGPRPRQRARGGVLDAP